MLRPEHTQLPLHVYKAALTMVIELHCLFRQTPELTDFAGPIIGACAALGTIEDKPPDISSLAAMTDMPRSTIQRIVRHMVQSGWLKTEEQRDRTLVLVDRPSDDFIRERDAIIWRFVNTCCPKMTRAGMDGP